ncbi:recombinase family protein [Streptomyces sp. NPDC046685]|uniref:recombinase family protein n=1 Tax=Streptomyces sp. NPDC046685 TaxID=3157202 RepID=UPI0033DC3933
MNELPIAYGYMRVRQEADDQELQLIEDRLHACAASHGLRIIDTHYEWGPGIAPQRLVRRLIKDDIRHVIVPSLVQITEHPLMQLFVSEWITLDVGALLYEASSVYGQVDVS